MLISDYLSSNIKFVFFFWFDPFERPRAEIEKYFRSILVQMKTSKFAFEIIWPLTVELHFHFKGEKIKEY